MLLELIAIELTAPNFGECMNKYGENFLDKPMSTILVKDYKACIRCGWFPYHGKIWCEGCGGLPETVKNMSIRNCLELARDRVIHKGWGGSGILGRIIGYFERQGEHGWGINNPNKGLSSEETKRIYKNAKDVLNQNN